MILQWVGVKLVRLEAEDFVSAIHFMFLERLSNTPIRESISKTDAFKELAYFDQLFLGLVRFLWRWLFRVFENSIAHVASRLSIF